MSSNNSYGGRAELWARLRRNVVKLALALLFLVAAYFLEDQLVGVFNAFMAAYAARDVYLFIFAVIVLVISFYISKIYSELGRYSIERISTRASVRQAVPTLLHNEWEGCGCGA